MAGEKTLRDNVSRVKGPSPLGRSIFVGLRLSDAICQFVALDRGFLVQEIGHLPGSALSVFSHSNGQLNPYYGLLVAMSLGSGLKQAFHMAFISEQEISVGSAFMIGFFNIVLNTVNVLAGVWSMTSQAPSSDSIFDILSEPSIAIGTALYVVGILTELISEIQRQSFKKNPANKGKPYGGGLFSLATNINYGGYVLCRAGFALTSGGWGWGLFNFFFFFYDFVSRGVPVLDQYCTTRYGGAWEAIKSRVQYRLLPWIY
ncbi:hypothetical protein F1880_007276 [Penicillium rolfsii]|nr:hypothetical protein F1880_007276 [Penicillium rolfsii]